ncbi:alpha-amylase family glycosyl hydrolase [Catalinimonas niigatensis]|uniref:alpha-amylase family glycosyl hydrolase n=1 Tax=Catalinimonas niigatensis TaxID=1397264 RepID=UPI0026668126|nr:alpha-amylase family glycosyl hydrolase [Catalinimonas niigatensis]WPP51261.1 alpha-amylase family glycosyl hydrolase [Catalinimonas niigatensis]
MKHHYLFLFLLLVHCTGSDQIENTTTADINDESIAFDWRNATIYFLLTDRFNNGNPENDVNFQRTSEAAKLRGFQGGDIAGITQKIEEGYFDSLGVNAIWFTPVVEQIHGATDEGTGVTYAYHGYWAKDWTTLDPNFGTMEELKTLVNTAHQHGIRVLLDVVANHTGPVTELDPAWPDNWVRQDPTCTYTGYETTVECTLVENLPDIHTEREQEVALPPSLVEKWQAEGRYEQELEELDAFFVKTGYPRAPTYYLVKWLTDYVLELGIDGFRVDTAKHTDADIWAVLKEQALAALEEWKTKNPDKRIDDAPFWMVGEVYNYSAAAGQPYDYGDTTVNFFENGFESLINFDFKYDAENDYEAIFVKYDTLLHDGALDGVNVLNYLSSHDDGSPYDPLRKKSEEAATKLLLSQGAAQIYYGDESDRSLVVEGTQGDATLRSFMNWNDIQQTDSVQKVLDHWNKLGTFRKKHIAIGAGRHQKIADNPYTFSRTYTADGYSDKVIVALDAPMGEKMIEVGDVFQEGTMLKDSYSGQETTVSDGKVNFFSSFQTVLLSEQ